ncbi:hypothetical protein [Sutcliffiella horikoshii]|uniref:hypothetical protein n=1 Tax=Sutcliffiella horikoshii TaxID=79883 RepID=UPI001CFF4236|nr:hypothetical protein [Sutcliffiella horikoshii]
MKKIIVSLVMLCLLFSVVGSPVFASESNTKKALELIEKTNQEIDIKIEKAVTKADKLHSDFLQELRVIEEGKELVKLKNEQNKVIQELKEASQAEKNDEKKIEKLNEKNAKLEENMKKELAKIDAKLQAIEADMNEIRVSLLTADDKDKKKLKEKMDKLKEKLTKKDQMFQENTEKYTKELDKVITDVFDETLEMSSKTIGKAAELGVEAECSWKLVRFADQWVWIDPIKIVGW